jgi:hypothetical protein
MAMAAMGNIGHAAADETLQAPTFLGATLSPIAGGSAAAESSGVQIHLEKSFDVGAALAETASPWYRTGMGAKSQRIEVDTINLSKRDGKTDKNDGPILGYAGVGLGKLKFSMDLDDGDLKLGKEKRYKRTQLFLGMRYKMAPRTSLALEYRALTGSNPAFENDPGTTIGSPTKLNNHNILMSLRYRF